MRNFLLTVGIIICLAVSINRVYETYFVTKPPAKIGECLQIIDPNMGSIQLKITSNNADTESSDAIATAEISPGVTIKAPVVAKYSELRQHGAKKVECSK